MSDEKAVKTAARLYECRDAARTLFGDRYEERVAGSRETIRKAMAHHKIGALQAALKLVQVAGLDGVSAIVMLAAGVDEAEAS